MTDQSFVMELEPGQRAIVEPDDDAWLRDRLQREPGSTRLRLRYGDDDTEGHASTAAVRVIADGGDDTEGHAISLHFPSASEADAFRKRLLVTGVLAGTVALGAAGGIGLANLGSGESAGAATQGFSQADQAYADRLSGQAAAGAATQGFSPADQAYADRLSGQAAAGAASQGLSPADQAYADRLSGQAAAEEEETDGGGGGKGSGLTPR